MYRMIILAALFIAPSVLHAVELKDVDRSKTRFMYHELGRHLPTAKHLESYASPREVITSTIRLPLEIDISAGNQMYCNTQVYGYNDKGKPGQKGNHSKNFEYPQSSTMCEYRGGNKLTIDQCGGIKKVH